MVFLAINFSQLWEKNKHQRAPKRRPETNLFLLRCEGDSDSAYSQPQYRPSWDKEGEKKKPFPINTKELPLV